MAQKISAFSLSDTGRKRAGNQDACGVFYHGTTLMMVVADGVGGQACGDVASRLTVDIFKESLENGPVSSPDTFLAKGAELANQAVRAHMARHPDCKGMATTLTVALIQYPVLHILHIGDSRGYLLRNGTLTQLTEDQTLVRKMVREGVISPEEARNHPKRHVILNAVGPAKTPSFVYNKTPLEKGDRILLCSDGLYDEISDGDIGDILSGKDTKKVIKTLIKAANEAGGSDNISVAVAAIDENARLEDTVQFTGAEVPASRRNRKIYAWVAVVLCAIVLTAGGLFFYKAHQSGKSFSVYLSSVFGNSNVSVELPQPKSP